MSSKKASPDVTWFDRVTGKNSPSDSPGGPDRQGASVAGYAEAGDGGGGVFYWDADSTAAAVPGMVVGSFSPSGRWIRAYSGPLNVRWFGAKGDGSTDDDKAIQNAVDHASARGGGTVFLPGGRYAVSTAIRLRSRVHVFGEQSLAPFMGGSEATSLTTIYRKDSGTYCLGDNNGANAVVAIEGVTNFRLSDLNIDGNKANNDIITGSGSNPGTQAGIWVSDDGQASLDQELGEESHLSADGLIERCFVRNTIGAGIALRFCRRITVQNCVSRDAGKNETYVPHGIILQDNASYCTVDNCIVQNNLHGDICNWQWSARYNRIVNSIAGHIYLNSPEGWPAEPPGIHVTVAGNRVNFLQAYNVSDFTFENNDVLVKSPLFSTQSSGISLPEVSGFTLSRRKRVRILQNRVSLDPGVSSSKTGGIDVNNCRGLTILGNIVDGSFAMALYIQSCEEFIVSMNQLMGDRSYADSSVELMYNGGHYYGSDYMTNRPSVPELGLRVYRSRAGSLVGNAISGFQTPLDLSGSSYLAATGNQTVDNRHFTDFVGENLSFGENVSTDPAPVIVDCKRTAGSPLSATIAPADRVIYVIHDSGPCDVHLPAEPVDRHDVIVKDGSSNAATHPIVIHAAPGTTIEGAPSLEISTDYGWVRLIYAETMGRRWLRLG